MKILVRVEAQARKNELIPLGERCFKIKTTKPAREGKANKDVIEILAKHFGVGKLDVNLLSGHRAKEKIFEISD